MCIEDIYTNNYNSSKYGAWESTHFCQRLAHAWKRPGSPFPERPQAARGNHFDLCYGLMAVSFFGLPSFGETGKVRRSQIWAVVGLGNCCDAVPMKTTEQVWPAALSWCNFELATIPVLTRFTLLFNLFSSST